MVFSPDSKRASVFSSDVREGTVHALDLSRGELQERRRIRTRDDIGRGVLSPDGQELAILTTDRVLALWDVPSGTNMKYIFNKDNILVNRNNDGTLKHEFVDIAFSPDGSLLAVVQPGTGILLLWELDSGEQRRFSLPPSPQPGVGFLPGGTGIVIHAPSGGRLVFGNPLTGKFGPSTATGHPWLLCRAFSPDGRMMATGGSDATIRLWDIGSREVQATLLGHHGEVMSLAWSPDGKVLASRSKEDHTVRFWDVAARQELGEIDEPGEHVVHLMFSPDGTTLAGYLNSPRPEVILWPAPRDEAPAH
jgi:WD40 repeat protein